MSRRTEPGDPEPLVELRARLKQAAREVMRRSGLSQVQLTRKTGLTQPSISSALDIGGSASADRVMALLCGIGADVAVEVRWSGVLGEHVWRIAAHRNEKARHRT